MSNGETNRALPTVEGIAIVGMAGRFPGSADVDALWRNLRDGIEGISFFSPEEMRAEGVSRETLALPNFVPAGGVLDDIDLFDAELFGFQPREVEVTDPQHRLFLECAFEALERAGYDPFTEPGAIGLFAGCGLSGYLSEVCANPRAMAAVGSYRAVLGNDKDFLSTWVSYKLNLRGPSLSVQTACSTSLVAVHLACQSLLNGECDMALAGGASVPARQRSGYLHQAGGIHSPDGHCRAFDARAQGTVRGSGVAVVVLRRLSDALASGDRIHAVIRGSAVNNDGALKIGYTAPSQEGQARVISEALSLAGLSPDDISYVEAHGTGTALGDPIEIAALTQVFRAGTRRRGFCGIGSVKTNLGHLDTASGIAGLIKTALALEHRQVPPSLHFETPHPNIDLKDSPFYINAWLTPWEPSTPGGLRRAGVSSFGIGGTNAHAVLEEAPALPPADPSRRLQHLFVLSARNEAALAAATSRLADHLEANPDLAPSDVAYTLQVGRKAFEHRRALVCSNLAEAVATMREGNPEKVWTRHERARFRPVAFLFPGQGAQHPGMARELYDGEPTFRDLVDHCAERLAPELGLDVRHVLYPPDGDDAAGERLEGTGLAQPALFVVEYALARLWMEWGVEPQAMLGHSVGEYVAACLAGVFSLDDALGLVAARGRLMQELPAGAMLAVALPERDVQSLLGESVAVAAVNGEARCVLSGTVDAIERLDRHFVDLGIECRRLHTSHAFHSPMMDPILEMFLARVREVRLRPPRIPYISNLSGTWITAAEATAPGYWVRHLRETVRFSAGAAELLAEPDRILLELGPGLGLTNLVKQHPARRAEQPVIAALPHPRQRESDLKTSLKALAQIWTASGRVDWRGFHLYERRRRVLLPTYPFQRKRYWVESEAPPAPVTSPTVAASVAPVFQALPAGSVLSSPEPAQRAEVRMSPIVETSVPARSRRDDILSILCEIVRELTGSAPGAAQIHTHFLEMGIESLLMIRATQALEDKLGVRISVVQLFEELTTLDLLAGHLEQMVPPDRQLAHLLPAGTSAPAAAAPAAAAPAAAAPAPAVSPAAPVLQVAPAMVSQSYVEHAPALA
ncbi:MAG TPA: beta-ketoacyl synthase N-terminal-like domain-containing protein, partial [Thermoanaerobaculia bacterium]|nr:beta-ketoacyl synthase N-terminal-like domain-containing protein [Thermoanaerobaculia bacterium]